MGIELDDPVEVRPRGEDDAFTILLTPVEHSNNSHTGKLIHLFKMELIEL